VPNPPAFDVPVTEDNPSRNIAVTFGVKKIRMAWLPDGEKKIENMITRFDNPRM